MERGNQNRRILQKFQCHAHGPQDVIGIIQSMDDITLKDLVDRLGQRNLQTKFSITNGSSNVNVTFWDALAKSFVQQLKLRPVEEQVIIIITSLLIPNDLTEL
ncbi:hypothetical protein POM88_035968 [Heracleum sosnowskyi]|uniref:Uncharacterized protein n=1 Tax=Heracleum sosnowskyi TaxID=360622 RepID=A0AAD8HMI4_9APIA|nr:hypothetical protein POM88_035968 [Heracleum sosnowskyi]